MKKEGRCDDAYGNAAVHEWRNEESGAGPLVETRHMQYTDDSISTWTVMGATIGRDGTITLVE
jgi:hypothetical protein